MGLADRQGVAQVAVMEPGHRVGRRSWLSAWDTHQRLRDAWAALLPAPAVAPSARLGIIEEKQEVEQRDAAVAASNPQRQPVNAQRP